jgi:hypothetical protein
MDILTNKLKVYMTLQDQVTLLGDDTDAADIILDAMDLLFYQLSEEEIAYLDKRVFMCGSDD